MIEVVASTQNKIVKLAAALKQKKYRDAEGLFIVEGVRLAEEALHSGWKVVACLFTDEAEKHARTQALLANLAGCSQCRLVRVSAAVYDKITDTEQPQGVMLILQKAPMEFDKISMQNGSPFIVVLDQVQDPGNVGAIIRTADAAGCTSVFMTKGCVDLFAGKTVRSTMGSLFHLDVYQGLDAENVINCLKRNNIRLMATALNASSIYYETDLTGPIAIVFGNEGHGVSNTFLAKATERLYVPIIGRSESLNVSVAAGVILYETLKQRTVSACN